MLFEIINKLSKHILHGKFMLPNLKIKKFLPIGILTILMAVIFFSAPILANGVHIIHYKNGFNYFKKSEAGPIILVTDFYMDDYRQFRSHAIRFYYKSTIDNTLHEIKSFKNMGAEINTTSMIDIYNNSGPDCDFSLVRLIHKDNDLILIFFERGFNADLTYADPSVLDISVFRLIEEESPLDASRYYFKRYKSLISKKAMCTSDEMDSYLRSNLDKLVK
jgi:hypothetical protein